MNTYIDHFLWAGRQKLTKIVNYEYWPWWLFYIPCIPYWLVLSAKAGSLMFFSNVNPGIYLGGLFGESKKDILDGIPKEYLPKTLFFEQGTDLSIVMEGCEKEGISFPFIFKPNVGERGNGVEKIYSPAQLSQQIGTVKEDFIIQEFIDYTIELGVFYHKYPNQHKSDITSVTSKEFLSITGNGGHTFEALIKKSVRASNQYDRMRIKFAEVWHEVIPDGEKILLEPIGNHCRGTMFLNSNHLINAELIAVFDKISKDIPGFFYGRYDLKVKSLEDLYAGKNIRVMELNGVASEPAHIYDPQFSLLAAYAELYKHLKIIAEISMQNQQKGIGFAPKKVVYNQLYRHFVKK